MQESTAGDSVKGRTRRLRRMVRRVFLVAGIILASAIARPAVFLWNVSRTDLSDRPLVPDGMIDDASALNATAVREIWPVPSEPGEAEQQLSELLRRARQDGLKVSIAGARHSMGGHSIAPGGIVIDMRPFSSMTLDETTDILTVGSGAVWHDVLVYLDPRGRSVQVMQSNDSFSVGGSISVNCHGWQYNRPPVASTVESFRLMKSDGTVVQCSREENSELFSLALGGYGLFGVILDVRLKVTSNACYKVTRYIAPAADAMATYRDKILNAGHAAMVYARMDVATDGFLGEVMIYVLEDDSTAQGPLAPLSLPGYVSLRRSIFHGSRESEYGKRLRWDAETRLQPAIAPTCFTRNQVMHEGVDVFQNRSAGSTDILHEYFLPPDQLEKFIVELQRIVPAHGANLLNVTIRSFNEDTDTFLRYADQPMLSVVMLFTQKRSDSADAEMQKLTQELIDEALALRGRFYLPYRLHATQEQFHEAYPQARKFFELKRKYDPDEIFVNQFYLRYGGSHVVTKKN